MEAETSIYALPPGRTTLLSGVPPKKNVPVSHKKVLESCLSSFAVSRYEVLFLTSGTFYGTEERFMGQPITPLPYKL